MKSANGRNGPLDEILAQTAPKLRLIAASEQKTIKANEADGAALGSLAVQAQGARRKAEQLAAANANASLLRRRRILSEEAERDGWRSEIRELWAPVIGPLSRALSERLESILRKPEPGQEEAAAATVISRALQRLQEIPFSDAPAAELQELEALIAGPGVGKVVERELAGQGGKAPRELGGWA